MSIATKAATATFALQGQGRVEASAPPPSSRESVLVNSPATRRTAEVQFDAGSGVGNRPGSHASPQLQPSDDSRYVRFVEAVQALRIDPEQTKLPPAQVERMMESAREIFKLDDGIPRPVRPPAPEPPSPPRAAADKEAGANATAAGAVEDDAAADIAQGTGGASATEAAGAARDEWEPVKAPATDDGGTDPMAETTPDAGADRPDRPDAATTREPDAPQGTAIGTAPSPATHTGPRDT